MSRFRWSDSFACGDYVVNRRAILRFVARFGYIRNTSQVRARAAVYAVWNSGYGNRILNLADWHQG